MKSAMDALIHTASLVQRALQEGHQVTLLSKDVVSAFNNVGREGTLTELRKRAPNQEPCNM